MEIRVKKLTIINFLELLEGHLIFFVSYDTKREPSDAAARGGTCNEKVISPWTKVKSWTKGLIRWKPASIKSIYLTDTSARIAKDPFLGQS